MHALVLVAGGSVAGRVVTPEAVDFGASPFVQVHWDRRETDPEALATSALVPVEKDGRFQASGVPADRDLEVRLDPWIAAEHGLRCPDPLTRIRAGARGLELRLVSGLSIRGQVTGPGADMLGKRLPNCRVIWKRELPAAKAREERGDGKRNRKKKN